MKMESKPSLERVSPVDSDGNERRWALIVVDVQNDFIDGSLSLRKIGEEASEVVPAINRLLDSVRFDMVIYSRDYHPPNHCSFDIPEAVKPRDDAKVAKWPVHCVQGTWGSEFSPELKIDPPQTRVVHVVKGTEPDMECFNAFGGIVQNQSDPSKTLGQVIQEEKIDTIFICGLATDICVLETCKGSKKDCPEQETYLLVDASRGTKKFVPVEYSEFKLTTTDQLINSCRDAKKKSLTDSQA